MKNFELEESIQVLEKRSQITKNYNLLKNFIWTVWRKNEFILKYK